MSYSGGSVSVLHTLRSMGPGIHHQAEASPGMLTSHQDSSGTAYR